MRLSPLLLVAAIALFASGRGESLAQTMTPQTMKLDECRAEAIGKGLAGEARNKAISDCVGRPVAEKTSSATSSRYAACRSEARARNVSGDAFSDFLDDCMSQSGAPSDGQATYADCRSRAVARGLTGEARSEFVNSCLND